MKNDASINVLMQPVPKPLDRAPSEVTCPNLSNPFLEDRWIPSYIHCVQKQSITISALYFSNVVWVILGKLTVFKREK